MRYALAMNRQIGISALQLLLRRGYPPSAIILSHKTEVAYRSEVERLCEAVPTTPIIIQPGSDFSSTLDTLSTRELDYIFSVHFPRVFPKALLELPKIGCVNLHPSLLPYNRGWNTPTWAILESTPFGATLHFMTEQVDEGDIIRQQSLDVLPHDTAHTLYQRCLELELQVLSDALDALASLSPPRTPQDHQLGTSHTKEELQRFGPSRVSSSDEFQVGDLLNKLRALTTNNPNEALRVTTPDGELAVQVVLTPIDT